MEALKHDKYFPRVVLSRNYVPPVHLTSIGDECCTEAGAVSGSSLVLGSNLLSCRTLLLQSMVSLSLAVSAIGHSYHTLPLSNSLVLTSRHRGTPPADFYSQDRHLAPLSRAQRRFRSATKVQTASHFPPRAEGRAHCTIEWNHLTQIKIPRHSNSCRIGELFHYLLNEIELNSRATSCIALSIRSVASQ